MWILVEFAFHALRFERNNLAKYARKIITGKIYVRSSKKIDMNFQNITILVFLFSLKSLRIPLKNYTKKY